MRYILKTNQNSSPLRKLGWGCVGLSLALGGSAALAWQNGASPKLRPAQVEEADIALPPVTSTAPPRAVQNTLPPATNPTVTPSLPPAVPPPSRPQTTVNESAARPRATTSQRWNPSAATKALGNRASSPPRTAAEAAAPPLATQPTPPAPRAVVKETSPPATPRVAANPMSPPVRPKLARIAPQLEPLSVAAHKNVRPAGFQDITPGETKLAELKKQLGEADATESKADSTTLTYAVGPFPKVEFILVGDLVDSIVIHLKEPAPEADVIAELSLTDFAGVDICDENGAPLGRAIPERGVALSYEGAAADKKVGQVVLAAVTAEPFLLRAANAAPHRYQNMLADALTAAALDPKSAQAHAICAQVFLALGRTADARTASEKAVKLDGEAGPHQLLHARTLAAAGDYNAAILVVQPLASKTEVPLLASQAETLWGEFLAHGPDHDYTRAIDHLTLAIKAATPLVQSSDKAIRRQALETLVDANLTVAHCVASGNYRRKTEVVPKWVAKADTLANQLSETGAGGKDFALRVAAKTLAAYAVLEEPLDPTAIVENAISAGQDLISGSSDPLYKQEVEWELGCALVDAVQIEHLRGQFDLALKYANNAIVLLTDNASQREAAPQRNYQLGRMFFAMGALYAVSQQDHAEAVHYYLQAQPYVSAPLPADLKIDAGRHGERLVSMGVSYWQNGNKDQAVSVTLSGMQLIREAADDGRVAVQSLVVPYSNLASMYRQLGNTAEATKFADLARRLENSLASPATKR